MQPSENTAPNKHILIISYYFPPMGGGGVQRILKFAKYWDYQKSNLSLLTVKESFFYADDPDLERDIPSRLNVFRSGSLDPFRIIFKLKSLFPNRKKGANASSGTESGGFIRRLANFIFLPDSRLLWFPFAVLKILKIHRQEPIDLIVSTMPPFTTGLIGFLAKKLFKISYLLDYRDAWTENPYLPTATLFHEKIQNQLEKIVMQNARAVVFINPNLEKYYLNKYTFLADRTVGMIRNGFDPDDFAHISPAVKKTNGRISFGVMGTIYSQGNSPEPFLWTVENIKKQLPEIYEKIEIIFLGKWTDEFYTKVRKMDINNCISWIPYQPHRKALQIASQFSSLLLAVDDNSAGSLNLTPGRIYEYLALKIPIFAICPPDSDVRTLISSYSAGIICDYNDREKIEKNIVNFVQNYEQIKAEYKFSDINELDRRVQTEKFQFLLESL